MKNILFSIMMLMCGTAFAQPSNIRIEPNLKKDSTYVLESQGYNNFPTGKRYARKGEYKSVLKSEFVSEIVSQVGAISQDTIAAMIVDSIAEAKTYYEYVAKVVQSGTSNPVATVLENTFTGTPTWTRSNVGVYRCTLTNQFTLNKSIDLVVHDFVNGSTYFSTGSFTSDDYYEMYSTNQTHVAADNAIFWISIKAYK